MPHGPSEDGPEVRGCPPGSPSRSTPCLGWFAMNGEGLLRDASHSEREPLSVVPGCLGAKGSLFERLSQLGQCWEQPRWLWEAGPGVLGFQPIWGRKRGLSDQAVSISPFTPHTRPSAGIWSLCRWGNEDKNLLVHIHCHMAWPLA